MKKKILSSCLACLFVFSLFTGCGKSPSSSDINLTVTTEQIPVQPSQTENIPTSEETNLQAEIIPVENLTVEQQNMLAVMDALNMCMVENNCEYSPEDPSFLWNALFYTIGNYPDIRDNEEIGLLTNDLSAGVMVVNYKLVQEYATGITETYSDLPELPADSAVSLNEDTEYYNFPMGDRGLSYGEIASWTSNGDGTHTVETRLIGVDDESLIAAYEYVLVENPYADAITDPMFIYTVRSVKKL